MYRNIIFDLGGVVLDWNPRDFLLDHFLNRRAEDIVYDLTFGSETWQALDRGELTREEGNRRMLAEAAQCGRTFEVQAVIDEWESLLRTKKTTIKIMCKLKLAGYRLYYLSNIAADTFAHIQERDFFPLFDGGIASCDVHINKPDPQIYIKLMEQYGLAYDETIFVDDSRENAQAAYNLGITGILYKNRKSFARALTACGIELPRKKAAVQEAVAAAQ